MPRNGPIIIVEDDLDDSELLKDIFEELKVPNILKFFNSCVVAFDYLLNTLEKPFLIISDINLPAMSGLDFLRKINENEHLRKKSVPFIFFSTTSNNDIIQQAYRMPVHGFFVKPTSVDEQRQMMKMIVDYWKFSKIPF